MPAHPITKASSGKRTRHPAVDPCIFRIIRIKDNVQLRADAWSEAAADVRCHLDRPAIGRPELDYRERALCAFAAAIVLVIHYVTDHTLPVPANALDLPTFIPRSEKETHTAE